MAWTDGRTWAAADLVTAAKMNEISASLNALGGAWASYTPVWTAAGTAISEVNATISGKHRTVGKTVDFRIFIIMGSSTTYGTSVYNFTLPSTPTLASWEAIDGSVVCTDTSASDRYGLLPLYSGGGKVTCVNGSASRISNTVPFTWANGDQLSISGSYEIA